MLKKITALGLLLGVPLAPVEIGSATIGPTFVARATFELCPEYPLGGVVFDVVYTIGSDPTLRTPEIIQQTIDSMANTVSVDISFPTSMGTTPFNVLSSCRNAFGYSDPSDALSVSNCDALAKLDSDGDGIPNNLEDTNCNNIFDPEDASNPFNVDTDGDGVRDLVELVSGTSRTNPGSSPRPFVFSSAPFDPDGDGNSNAVVWRPVDGNWYIRDFVSPGNLLAVQFGLPGDIPFTYQPKDSTSSFGVVRPTANDYVWYFYGIGFQRTDDTPVNQLTFGVFGDNVIPGPWEEPGVTNPAVARVFNGVWTFVIYLSDGTAKNVVWGTNGDLPKVDDYDGDGLFDVAVYRPSENKTFVISSIDGSVMVIDYGSGTSELTVRGDYSGDGKAEISYWEPATGMFFSLLSDNGFDPAKAAMQDPLHQFEMQLGLYFVHLPLNWNRQNGKLLYTVVDHATGLRYFREDNEPEGEIQVLQWGLPGDSQG